MLSFKSQRPTVTCAKLAGSCLTCLSGLSPWLQLTTVSSDVIEGPSETMHAERRDEGGVQDRGNCKHVIHEGKRDSRWRRAGGAHNIVDTADSPNIPRVCCPMYVAQVLFFCVYYTSNILDSRY